MKSSPTSVETAAVLASTRALIDWTRGQSGHGYADEFFSPISDFDIEVIARRFSCHLVAGELPAGVQEIGIPGYTGLPTIVVSRSLPPPVRRLATRHGLAHLVAGELEGEHDSGVRFMSSIHDWTSLEERRADLFALADLIPDRELAAAVATEASPAGALQWMRERVGLFAGDWPEGRIEDRARLRWGLYFGEG